MIYFDNSATSIYKPDRVKKAILEGLELGNSARGNSSLAISASREIFKTRREIGKFFNIDDPRRVVFTKNSTDSLNIAINGLIDKNDHVITTYLEHNSVLRPLYAKEAQGAELTILYPEDGKIRPEDVEKAVKENTKALVITAGSNVMGYVPELKEILELAKSKGLITIVDGSQPAGSLKIDLKELKIDALAITGHKGLFGPQGIGALIINPDIDIMPYSSGGTGFDSFNKFQPSSYPDKLEAGTLNGPGIMGLKAGIEFIEEVGLENIQKKEEKLLNYFYDNIREIPGLTIYGKIEDKKLAIVSVNLGELSSQDLSQELLERYGIVTRGGFHCAPLVHKFYGTEDQGMVRFSFSYFNEIEELDLAIEALRELSEEYI